MSEFTKGKIAFAVALLAVIFTVSPVLEAVGTAGFDLFGLSLQVRHLFYFVSAALGFTVYCYSIQFITERQTPVITVAADVFYAMAIVAPVLYILLFIGVQLAAVVTAIARSPVAGDVIRVAVSLLVGIIGYFLGAMTKGQLAARERESSIQRLEDEGVVRLRRAEELFGTGHYDLAVVESFRALESVVQKSAITHNRPFGRRWIEELRSLLPAELRGGFERLRQVRNMAAHSIEPISSEQAREALAVASRVLAFMGDQIA